MSASSFNSTSSSSSSSSLGSLTSILSVIPPACMDDVGSTLGYIFGTCKVQLSKLANITTATGPTAPLLANYLPADQIGCLCAPQTLVVINKLVTDCSALTSTLTGVLGAPSSSVPSASNMTAAIQTEFANQCKNVKVVAPATAAADGKSAATGVTIAAAAVGVLALFL
ncbi:UNVERIFIED_CONTAM: hypothetical protein HDU68_011951 [Siphonaria sp. JEL0065]|nr:hypothetical protein HDU68_011951 [Siphonaria sp. JEL0065]